MSVRLNFKPSDSVSPNQQKHPINSRTIIFLPTNQPHQNPQNEKICAFWVMILKYRRINPRDIKITIVLLVYMPILGAIGLMVKSDLIIDIAMTIPLLFSIIFMLRYNWFFVLRYIVWVPRNIRSIVSPHGYHDEDQYEYRAFLELKLAVALLFYMPILGIIGIPMLNYEAMQFVGFTMFILGWAGSLYFGIGVMCKFHGYFLYLHTRCIPDTIVSSIRRYNARRQHDHELPTRRMPI